MSDRGLWILEQYGLTPKTTCKGRGVLLYETQEGWVSIKEFGGTKQKLEQQYALMEKVKNSGFPYLDCLRRNLEGELLSCDREENAYVVRDWYTGKECDTRSITDIERAVEVLAGIHKVMQLEVKEEYVRESLIHECIRHNTEIRKTRKFIQKRQKKNAFEMKLLASMELFLRCGEEMVEELKNSDYEQLRADNLAAGSICHGDYNQHNLLFAGNRTIITNFDKWNYDIQTADLYHFMRKILEKHNWDIAIGVGMLETYQKVRALSSQELCDLRLRLSYPWKFWKLVNHYSNNNKVWISGKNVEKLEQLQQQYGNWQHFLKNAF